MASNTVRVRVYDMQAKGLRPADSNGLSDPFAKLKCGKEKFQTDVAKETLDPVWPKVRGARAAHPTACGRSRPVYRRALLAPFQPPVPTNLASITVIHCVQSSFVFGAKEDLESLKGIAVTLYDKDFLGRDLLGTVFLPFDELWEVPEGTPMEAWRPVDYQGVQSGTYVPVQMCVVCS